MKSITKEKIVSILNSLLECVDENQCKIKSINFESNEIIFSKDNEIKTLDIDLFIKETPNDKNLSDTSEDNEELLKPKEPLKGGNLNKNVFQKISDTSSVKYSDMSLPLNLSQTSYNGRSDKYSDTSIIGQMGGNLDISDTLMSVSELKDRKNKITNNSNLNLGIFKKVQSGGSTNNELNKKIKEIGINSSSTSSICE